MAEVVRNGHGKNSPECSTGFHKGLKKMSARVPSDRRSMGQAFKRNYQAAQTLTEYTRPRLMLLFYAAEAGLKAICMHEHTLKDSEDLGEYMNQNYRKKDGHDLEILITIANINATDIVDCPGNFPIMYNGRGLSFRPFKIHEAARYGVKVCPQFRNQIETWLESICQVLNRRLG
ncbi:hypothetical protein JHL17_00295 [Azospirillum sp. YIM B02556]|uniref:HEPN domain-containing protein n=1 Tax=Azospirillum endophyticum TaxID=2800326 RepID=A0ABS1EXG5_9PROT|nr:hypothetical protein [Azospirillum endophyticum]MBK1835840.1 hypothetical protein [Azospirillum endophyticum]